MRVLIVDDEALARSRLKHLLADVGLPALSIQEAADVLEAMRLLHHSPVEVLLLDINMPGASGLNLARELRALPQAPAIIFVTAHSEHALQAFELDAVDYLTKPVSLDRLQQALTKAQRQLALRAPSLAQDAAPQFLLIHDRGRTLRVPLQEVLYFKAELKYITVRTAKNTHILDGSLTEIEQQYGANFLRVHRNALVAKQAIIALEKQHDPSEGEIWSLRLRDIPELLAISRRQLPAVRSALHAA